MLFTKQIHGKTRNVTIMKKDLCDGYNEGEILKLKDLRIRMEEIDYHRNDPG